MTTLGIVLGGGGARGLAHIGVLRALADVDLHPDVVVGVSMGAVVGAVHAARPDWWEALRDFDRSPLPGHENIVDADGFDLVRAVVRSAVRMAPKVIGFGRAGGYREFGQQVMEDLLGPVTHFEDLRLPLAITATDLGAGRRAVFREGPIIPAVLASAALPVMTRPIPVDGIDYLDGGFADPAPVDIARQMGADVVVMVHVGATPSVGFGSQEADGPLMGVLRGLEIGAQRFVETRLAQADLLVSPKFDSGRSWLSFDHADDMAIAGHAAMQAGIPALLDLMDR